MHLCALWSLVAGAAAGYPLPDVWPCALRSLDSLQGAAARAWALVPLQGAALLKNESKIGFVQVIQGDMGKDLLSNYIGLLSSRLQDVIQSGLEGSQNRVPPGSCRDVFVEVCALERV